MVRSSVLRLAARRNAKCIVTVLRVVAEKRIDSFHIELNGTSPTMPLEWPGPALPDRNKWVKLQGRASSPHRASHNNV